MPISAEMVKARQAWIGSSDISAILGLNRYRSAHDVFLEKTDQLEPSPASKAADAGNRFENAVLDEAEENLGPLERNVHVKALALPFPMASNLDARVIKTLEPVESKTAGLYGPLSADWNHDAIDGVPDMYIAQCQAHLLITDRETCHLPAFLGGVGFRMFRINRNAEFLKIMIERCAAFWKLVETRSPPGFSMPTADVVKRIRRQPNKVAIIPAEVLGAWLHAKEVEKEAESNRKTAEVALLAALGDAEAGEAIAGRISYNVIERDGYTVRPTTYRQLRFKKC